MNRKQELLLVMMEECAEVIQAVSKVRRFGETAYSPLDKKKIPNMTCLETEIGDILGVLKLLIGEGHVDGDNIQKAAEKKVKKLEKYMATKKGDI
jgi:NTP pyrophosphatase (non-canonical NTP hydrolase)